MKSIHMPPKMDLEEDGWVFLVWRQNPPAQKESRRCTVNVAILSAMRREPTFITKQTDIALRMRPMFHARNDSRGVSEVLRSSPDSDRNRSNLGANISSEDVAKNLSVGVSIMSAFILSDANSKPH